MGKKKKRQKNEGSRIPPAYTPDGRKGKSEIHGKGDGRGGLRKK